jgi:large subunit ribosomal protein L10
MARPDKVAAVAELTDAFRACDAAVLTEYRGLTVSQLKTLRRTLGDAVSYAVVKNTLTKIAARNAGVDAFDALLQGPSAIAFVTGDPVEAAKGLRNFSRANPLLVIKGGLLDGRAISADEIRRLADVEPREVLLAKLAGAMKASLSGALALFAAPLSQAARVLDALRVAAEHDPSLLRAGAGTPVAAADTTGASEASDALEASEAIAAASGADTPALPDASLPAAATQTSAETPAETEAPAETRG